MINFKNINKKALIKGLIIIVVVVVGIYAYFSYLEKYPGTEDAYVNANLINVTPKVSGYVAEVLVKNNQLVKKGAVLFRIEAKDYSVQLAQQQAALNYTKEEAKSANTQVATAKANLESTKANYNFMENQVKRYTRMLAQDAASVEELQNYKVKLASADASVKAARNSLQQAENQANALEAKVKQSQMGVENAKNHVGYTDVISSVNSYVTNLNLSPGQFVAAGRSVFGLVDNGSWWVDANFKETDLERVKVGQKVEISLDMYKKAKYTGVVQSISYASGTTFSILPAQNATGNWVKVTQRFTIRIAVKNNPVYPLRVGASTSVVIDTTSKS